MLLHKFCEAHTVYDSVAAVRPTSFSTEYVGRRNDSVKENQGNTCTQPKFRLGKNQLPLDRVFLGMSMYAPRLTRPTQECSRDTYSAEV